MLPLGPDGHVYLTTKLAAETFGVDHSTISNWKRRGLLTPYAVYQGRPVYRLIDVACAEQAARAAALQTAGTDKRVRRQGRLRVASAQVRAADTPL